MLDGMDGRVHAVHGLGEFVGKGARCWLFFKFSFFLLVGLMCAVVET